MLMVLLGTSGISMVMVNENVPPTVKAAFKKKFPKAQNVEWDTDEEGEYEAEFDLLDKFISATFSEDGEWLKTETSMEVEALPQVIKDAISDQFDGYEVADIEYVEMPDVPSTYEVRLQEEEEYTTIEATFNDKGAVAEEDGSR